MKVARVLFSFVVVGSVGTLSAQQRPAIRQLGPVTARSTETIGAVGGVRHLPAGVLVNDVPRRRVLLFDSTLTKFSVVADSTTATASAYSGRIGGLFAYRGDSALFVDPQSMSMMVIDPSGKLGRVMSVPRSQEAMMLASGAFGTPGFDAAGRLIYRGQPQRIMPAPPAPGQPFVMPPPPDSAPIVRIDLATRKYDTLTFIKTPKIKFETQQVNGRMNITSTVNPLPVVDDWAVLSNGSLAVVRGQDYRVDIFGADGAKISAPKIPFDWQRLTDEDKIAFIDSVKAARERMMAAASRDSSVAGGGTVTAGGGGGAAPGEMRMSVTMTGPGGEGRPGGAAGARPTMGQPQMNFVLPSDLPDYKPAFFAGSTRADAEGNLWIRTIPTKAIPGGPVYDVLNGRGELVERVQIPANRNIVGFGAGGVVYMTVREENNTYLERARVR